MFQYDTVKAETLKLISDTIGKDKFD